MYQRKSKIYSISIKRSFPIKNYKILISIVLLMASFHSVSYSQIRPYQTIVHDGDWDRVGTLAFSPDGSRLITGMFIAHVWDTKTGDKLFTLPKEMSYVCAEFSPDGSLLATGGRHLLTQIWDSDTGQLLHKLQQPVDYNDPNSPYSIDAITFIPDSNAVIQIDQHGNLSVWNYLNDSEEKIIQKTGFSYGAQLISIDKERCIISSSIVSLTEKQILYTLEQGAFIAYNNDRLYSGRIDSGSNDIFVIEIHDKNTYKTIQSFNSIVYSGGKRKISPDGKYLLVGHTNDNSEETRIVDTQTGQIRKTFLNSKGMMDNVEKIVFSPNGKQVALVNGNTVNLYDISDLTSGVKNAEQLGQ